MYPAPTLGCGTGSCGGCANTCAPVDTTPSADLAGASPQDATFGGAAWVLWLVSGWIGYSLNEKNQRASGM